MSGPSDGSRNSRLDTLNKAASIDTGTANNYAIRSWLTSAKKCLDQVCPVMDPVANKKAEMDVGDNDPEAAYVNYVRAISIVAEVIPRHKGMKDIDERKTIEAQEYWIFRKVLPTSGAR
jgi:hypothetical protein